MYFVVLIVCVIAGNSFLIKIDLICQPKTLESVLRINFIYILSKPKIGPTALSNSLQFLPVMYPN